MAKRWVQGVLRYNLRSFQLGFRIMSISHKYPRHHPKRQLSLRLASHCGNQQATREFKSLLQDKITEAQIELKQLPDMTVCEWGKKKDLGKLVSRAGKGIKISLKIFQTFFQFPTCHFPPALP